jgi:hypothetical protein
MNFCVFVGNVECCVDETELDIPIADNTSDNEEEQEQPEIDEQEYYAEGLLIC